MGYRVLRTRGLPGVHPWDFPRGLGGDVGVPIAAKTPPNAYRNSSWGQFIH
jgi:hypothetical protein